jgi:tRNA-dihydrouridine synthase 3
MNDVENFDFDSIFDDHTIQVKKEFVDVAFILQKRAENEERLREAAQRKKEAEERVQATVVTENGSDGQKRESDALADETPPEKRAKVRGKKERGQNKNRGQHFEDKLDDKQKICRAYMKGECDRNESECKWSHDEMSIYNNREQDLGLVLGMSCPTYEKYGYCHYGISCRFCDAHITLKDGKLENHKHPTVEHRRIDYYESNRVNGTFLSMLRSNRYAFSKTVSSLKEVQISFICRLY